MIGPALSRILHAERRRLAVVLNHICGLTQGRSRENPFILPALCDPRTDSLRGQTLAIFHSALSDVDQKPS